MSPALFEHQCVQRQARRLGVCLSVFVLLCCFMSCLLRFLLFDVFYGLYSGGVSVFSDVASCLVFYGFVV